MNRDTSVGMIIVFSLDTADRMSLEANEITQIGSFISAHNVPFLQLEG